MKIRKIAKSTQSLVESLDPVNEFSLFLATNPGKLSISKATV